MYDAKDIAKCMTDAICRMSDTFAPSEIYEILEHPYRGFEYSIPNSVIKLAQMKKESPRLYRQVFNLIHKGVGLEWLSSEL